MTVDVGHAAVTAHAATDQWLRATLTAHGLQQAIGDPEWSILVTRAREAALAGHDPTGLLEGGTIG
jgi:hypothetical protein